MKNYYEILGLSKEASQEDIKKAYRKLAMEHHPDKGGNDAKFKEIAEAYETLSDPNKKNVYDNGGNQRNPFQGTNFEQMFQEMFNNSSFTQQRRRSAPDKMVEVQVSVIESFKGINKTINYAKRNPCDLCDGKGGDRKICTSCNGQGVITKMAGTGFFNQVVRIACEKCQGKGFTLSNVCSKCHGSETNIVMESISISIPKGADDGMFLRLSGKGDYAMGVMGDLVLKVKLIPEQNFEKYGNDLIYNHYFDLKTILEDSFEINHPDGKLSVKVPLDFDSSKSLRIKGKGFVTNTVGDLYVKLNVKFNRELNK